MTSALVLCSGGIDSSTLAYLCKKTHNFDTHLLAINYGQRHVTELCSAERIGWLLEVPLDVVDLRGLRVHLAGSALTNGSVEVPEGHYTDEIMGLTVVPNRNSIFINIAAAIAACQKIDLIAVAVHAGDHPIYKDCRPKFIQVMQMALNESLDNPVTIFAPFLGFTKADIIQIGAELGVPYEQTWSCYKGITDERERQCGKCGTCVERREAFELAGVPDPTEYLE